jgi:hypothetical protein
MSAGEFVQTGYECEGTGQVHPIRINGETLTLSVNTVNNTAPTQAPDTPVSARVAGGRRGIGVFARTVTIRFDLAATPSGYKKGGTITLPWLQSSTFNNIAKGQSVQYLGNAGKVVSKRTEKVS